MNKKMNKHSLSKSLKTLTIVLIVFAAGVGARILLRSTGIVSVSEQSARAQDALTYVGLSDDILTQLQMRPEVVQAHGVKFTASNFYAAEDSVFVQVCLRTGKPGIWETYKTTLKYSNGELSDYAVYFDAAVQDAEKSGPPAEQCMVLRYTPPAGADLSALTLNIESIVLNTPDEANLCEEYNARLASNKTINLKGIKIQCVNEPGKAAGPIITEKPANMNMAAATDLLFRVLFNEIDGPWVFTGTIN